MPVHVVFLELIIDPACSVAFEAEPEEPTLMKRPPRAPSERLFGKKRVLLGLLQGFTVLLTTLAVYGAFLYFGHDEMDSRAAGFSALVMGNLALIFTNRSRTRTIWQTLRFRNRALWIIVLGAICTLLLTLYVCPVRSIFISRLCISGICALPCWPDFWAFFGLNCSNCWPNLLAAGGWGRFAHDGQREKAPRWF